MESQLRSYDVFNQTPKKASLVAQTVKSLPAMQETRVLSLGQEDPLEKETATHSSLLAWKITWMEEPGRQHPMGSQRARHGSATNTHTYTHTRHPKKPPRALLCKLCQALKTVRALGPAAAVLGPGQTSPRATKYKDTEGPGLQIAAGTPS